MVKPSIMEPLPKEDKAKIGIAKPPIKRPMPFKVSLTATHFKPPNIA